MYIYYPVLIRVGPLNYVVIIIIGCIMGVVVVLIVIAIIAVVCVSCSHKRKQHETTVRGGMYCTVVIVTV